MTSVDGETPSAETRPTLRRATLLDLPAAAALHRLAFFTTLPQMPVLHTPEEDLEHYRHRLFPHSVIWLAEQDHQVVGLLVLRADWVEQLHVHPDYQRRGIGSRLLNLAKEQCDAPELRLWTFQANARAQRFYEKHGFQIERKTDGSDNEEKQPDVLYVWTRPV